VHFVSHQRKEGRKEASDPPLSTQESAQERKKGEQRTQKTNLEEIRE